jgi:hypothetical protein
MKILVENTATGFVPYDDFDLEEKKKFKIGEKYWFEVKKARNYLFHKKFFSLIKVGHDNTKLDLPFDVYRKVMIIKAGYFKAYNTGKGTYYEADSISFESMDEEKFQEVYSRVLDKIIEDIGTTKEIIEQQLLSFL